MGMTDGKGEFLFEVEDPGKYIVFTSVSDYPSAVKFIAISWPSRGQEQKIELIVDKEF